MNSTLQAPQFLGASLAPRSIRRPAGARHGQPLKVHAIFDSFPRIGRGKNLQSSKDRDTVKRGQQGQVRQAGKLLPKDPKKLEQKPAQAKKMFDARNRGKGSGGGQGPWQKIDPNTPGYRGIPRTIDPLIYVGGLIAVFVALSVGLVSQG